MIRGLVIFSILGVILYLMLKYPSFATVITLVNIWIIYHFNRRDIESLAKNQKNIRDGVVSELKLIKKELQKFKK